MQTYTSSRALYGTLTNNASASNLTVGDKLINICDAKVIKAKNWDFLENDDTISTVANQQFYTLPYDLASLKSVTVLIQSINYQPKECPTRDYWNYLNESTVTTSDIPEWYYISEGKIGFSPIPTTDYSNNIFLVYGRKRKDLSIPDYTTGSIVSVANDGILVTGSGTAWTDKMNGMWIRITDSQADNTGDGFWYQIATVSSGTTLNLKRTYGGNAIVAGTAAYTIGQTSLLPEDYQDLPIFKATEIYYTSVQPDKERADQFKMLYNEGIKLLTDDYSEKGTSPAIEDEEDYSMKNPNLFVRL